MEMLSHITNEPPFLNTSKAAQATAVGQTVSTQKAKQILGWTPHYTIISALEHAGKWYLENKWF